MNTGISIILCCYNSAARLPKTLEHIAVQEIDPHIPIEVILVDNNSTDNTPIIANEIWNSFISKIPFRVIHEKNQGISHARKAGVHAAQFEYLLFCDDDNWLAPDYAQIAFNILEKDKSIGAVGGRSEVVSDIPIPYWFSTYQKEYAVGVQNLQSGALKDRKYLWGAGITVRRSFLLKLFELDIKPILVGRKGKAILSGEDVEMCQWIIWANYRLWYSEDLRFKHYMPQSRLTKEYYFKQNLGHNESSQVIQKYSMVSRHGVYRSNILFRIIFFFIFLFKHLFFRRPIDRANLEIFNFSPYVFDSEISQIIKTSKLIKENW